MTRYLLQLRSDLDRQRAQKAIWQAPAGTRVELKAAKRTLPQNDRMWAMLSDIAMQKEHHGRKYTPEAWKVIFMHALGRETQFVPALDGADPVPLGLSSSDLSKQEMSDLIDLIAAWGAENGVAFHDCEPTQAQYLAAG